ncbi:MAG: cupin domain-containing protein [Tissierellia bacterium]|nr:cupin domain-containing protein [Tissierellia bacterium]
MYNPYNEYPCPNMYSPWRSFDLMYNNYRTQANPYYYTPMNRPEYVNKYPQGYPFDGRYDYSPRHLGYPTSTGFVEIRDYGPNPFVIDIEEATVENNNFRSSLWTGDYLQLTVMSLNPGEEIGLELHPDTDQFVRIEDGRGLVLMGDSRDNLNFEQRVEDDFIFIIPAGKWHNLINIGNEPLKLYSIYAPPEHPHGTVHRTKAESDAAEDQ